MAGTLIRGALRRAVTRTRYVAPVRMGRARGLVATVYRQMERDFGMLAPPVALHSPAPELLAGCWMMLRETLVVPGAADRASKEAVATAVSRANSCPYCVEVHSAVLDATASGNGAEATTPRTPRTPGDLAGWTVAGTTSASAVAPRPDSRPARAELAAVAMTFHYLNRMVNVFLGDSPLPPSAPPPARRLAQRMLPTLLLAPSDRIEPGASLPLLPEPDQAHIPAGRAGDGRIDSAFARAAGAIDAAGRRRVPEPVRDLVNGQLSEWDGQPPGISRGWVDTALGELAPVHRPAGRLALLTAMASYQVDQPVIDQFRGGHPGDRALIETTAWASFAAARRVTNHLTAPRPADHRQETGTATNPSSPPVP